MQRNILEAGGLEGMDLKAEEPDKKGRRIYAAGGYMLWVQGRESTVGGAGQLGPSRDRPLSHKGPSPC